MDEMLTHTHTKKKQTQTTLPVDAGGRKRSSGRRGKCNRSLRTVLKSNLTPVGAGMKLTGGDGWTEQTQDMSLEKQRFPAGDYVCLCLRLLKNFSPSTPRLHKKKEKRKKASCCHTGMLPYLTKKVKGTMSHLHKTILKTDCPQ